MIHPEYLKFPVKWESKLLHMTHVRTLNDISDLVEWLEKATTNGHVQIKLVIQGVTIKLSHEEAVQLLEDIFDFLGDSYDPS